MNIFFYLDILPVVLSVGPSVDPSVGLSVGPFVAFTGLSVVTIGRSFCLVSLLVHLSVCHGHQVKKWENERF